MATITVVFQVMSLGGSVAIVAVLLRLALRFPAARIVAVVPGVWAGFGVVFYALLLAGRFSPEALLLWGAVHRFMAVALVLGIAITLYGVLVADEATLSELPEDEDYPDGPE